jgi:hypothetical protein
MVNFQDTLFVKDLHYQSNTDYVNLTANFKVHPVNKNPVISLSLDVFRKLRKIVVRVSNLF